MPSPNKSGLSGGQVADWNTPDNFTPTSQTSFFAPYGFKLRQVLTSTGSVTIPAGINFVYAVVVGGGAGGVNGSSAGGGGAGGVAWGWTLAQSTCIVGAGGAVNASSGGYTRYGNIIAGGGGGNAANGFLGGAGGGSGGAGATNYWGIPNGSA